MNTWKLVTGIILLIVGLVVFGRGYNMVNACNSLGGKLTTVITSIFGGNGAQTCYNAHIAEVGGIIVALIGVVVIVMALKGATTKKGRK